MVGYIGITVTSPRKPWARYNVQIVILNPWNQTLARGFHSNVYKAPTAQCSDFYFPRRVLVGLDVDVAFRSLTSLERPSILKPSGVWTGQSQGPTWSVADVRRGCPLRMSCGHGLQLRTLQSIISTSRKYSVIPERKSGNWRHRAVADPSISPVTDVRPAMMYGGQESAQFIFVEEQWIGW